MSVIYNENARHPAQWLENLCTAGLIESGGVIKEGIEDVQPNDVEGATRVHFFAGIGGWAEALRLAGWPPDVHTWTGSCPCQPFSVAGRGRGTEDERHLWPAWLRLIRECRPSVILGEQVDSPDGRNWLDDVSLDLEGVGYRVAAASLCAAGVGAPHQRPRLYFCAIWMGDSNEKGLEGRQGKPGDDGEEFSPVERASSAVHSERLGDSDHQRLEGGGLQLRGRRPRQEGPPPVGASSSGRVADAGGEQLAGRNGEAQPGDRSIQSERQGDAGRPDTAGGGETRGFWGGAQWLHCTDGKARPTKPGVFPLAHGVSGRMAFVRPGVQGGTEVKETHYYSRTGALKGIGNAIVPQVAAVFVRAVMDILGDES